MGLKSDRPDRDNRAGGSAPDWVVGPLGQRLTRDQLPPPDFNHWVPLRKAEIVAAVTGGLISIDEVLRRYAMTLDEYAEWERAVQRFGLAGLRTTRAGRYREIQERERNFWTKH